MGKSHHDRTLPKPHPKPVDQLQLLPVQGRIDRTMKYPWIQPKVQVTPFFRMDCTFFPGIQQHGKQSQLEQRQMQNRMESIENNLPKNNAEEIQKPLEFRKPPIKEQQRKAANEKGVCSFGMFLFLILFSI